ncbi:hypothetical protein K469DRAFT_749720 [Zopfia rhizophila CBS 207.26]|uniref:Uncharacterized protein n=1 Tax=Zopfia rhizophila CBS 207.26 TaxID=1314779 RepID=A0A6A6E6A1_9PEZI|nr:hypothetical protein K469DRAFT_749720 [Zopfia rhizophila CBS 207.26]
MTATLTYGDKIVYIPSWSTSTNLGPLPTTTFPSDCLSSLWSFSDDPAYAPWIVNTQGCAAKACCPSGNVYTENWGWMTSYYSPGVCPEHYRSCPGPESPSALKTESGETIAFCCPTNYNCPRPSDPNGYFGVCGSLLGTPTGIIVMNNIFDQKVLSTSSWSLVPSMTARGQKSWQIVMPIQVRIRESETIPSTTPATITATTDSQPTTASTILATSAPRTPGLSTGAKAGIGVGAAVGALALVGLGFFIARAYQWKRVADAARRPGAIEDKSESGVPVSPGNYHEPQRWERHELAGSYHERPLAQVP